jgi:hypothetical protein
LLDAECHVGWEEAVAAGGGLRELGGNAAAVLLGAMSDDSVHYVGVVHHFAVNLKEKKIMWANNRSRHCRIKGVFQTEREVGEKL